MGRVTLQKTIGIWVMAALFGIAGGFAGSAINKPTDGKPGLRGVEGKRGPEGSEGKPGGEGKQGLPGVQGAQGAAAVTSLAQGCESWRWVRVPFDGTNFDSHYVCSTLAR